MSYRPPYGINIPIRYATTYTPPHGNVVVVTYSAQEKIGGFFAPSGIAPSSFGTSQVTNKKHSVIPSGIASVSFGAASVKNNARVVLMQSHITGIFGVPRASNVRKLVPVGIAPSGGGRPFNVVLGYYSPPYGQNIPISYHGAYLPLVGRGIPIDYANTHEFRQVACFGIAPVGFGTTQIRNKSQDINLAFEGIGPNFPGTAALHNKTQYIKTHSMALNAPSINAAVWNYRIIIGAKGYPFETFGTSGIVNRNRAIYPQGIGNSLYFPIPTIRNAHQYASVSGFTSYGLGAVNIGWRTRTVKPGNFGATGVGAGTKVAGTYVHKAGLTTLTVSGFMDDVFGTHTTVSSGKQILAMVGFDATLWGTPAIAGNVIGPCSVVWTPLQFGIPKLPATQYITTAEVEPKIYQIAGPPPVLSAGCGASFFGTAQFNPRYINLDTALHPDWVMDYYEHGTITDVHVTDHFGPNTVVTYKNRTISAASPVPQTTEVFGVTYVMNKERQIYPQGIGSPYFGIPSIPSGIFIMPFWGFTTPYEVPEFAAPTDGYGNATVGPPVRTGPFTQTVGAAGFTTTFGSTTVSLFHRVLRMTGWDSSMFFGVAAAPPFPLRMNGFEDDRFGTTWASHAVRNAAMQGFVDETFGLKFPAGSTSAVTSTRVRLAWVKVYTEGIEPIEPLVGFSCGRWNKTQTKVAYRPRSMAASGINSDNFGVPGVMR